MLAGNQTVCESLLVGRDKPKDQPNKNMSAIGMWMPKQKAGKNWMVTFVIETPEGTITREWKHRVREGCQDQIKEYRAIAARNEGWKIASAKITKI